MFGLEQKKKLKKIVNGKKNFYFKDCKGSGFDFTGTILDTGDCDIYYVGGIFRLIKKLFKSGGNNILFAYCFDKEDFPNFVEEIVQGIIFLINVQKSSPTADEIKNLCSELIEECRQTMTGSSIVDAKYDINNGFRLAIAVSSVGYQPTRGLKSVYEQLYAA